MNSPTAELSGFQASAASAFSVAARAGGAVISLGYLLGLAEGPVVAVVGGLALITFGRNLLLDQRAAVMSGAALAVIAAALGIAALRWGALDLIEVRGIQSVLGPTVLVGPPEAATATSIAAAAALAGLVVWMSRPWPASKVLFGWWGLEAGIVVLAWTALFFEPTAMLGGSGGGSAGSFAWVGAAALVTGAVGAGAWLLQKTPPVVPGVLTATAGAAVAAAAAVLVTAL